MRTLRHSRVLIALALCLLAAGCTRLGFVYNHLHTLALFELRSFVDLDKPQRAAFDAAFHELWRWHRSTQLPLLAADLRSLAQAVQAPLAVAEVERISERAAGHGTTALRAALRAAAPLLLALDDEQVASILAQIEKRSAKAQKKRARLGDAEWAEERYDDLIDSIDEWAGSVTPAQKERVRRWSQELIRLRTTTAAPERRAAFAALLRSRREPGFGQRLEDFFLPGAAVPRQASERQRHEMGRVLAAELSAMATSAQRQHLRARLESFAQQLEHLAREVPAAAAQAESRAQLAALPERVVVAW